MEKFTFLIKWEWKIKISYRKMPVILKWLIVHSRSEDREHMIPKKKNNGRKEKY